MKRAITFTLFALAGIGFAQQNKDPVSSVVKEILPHQEKNLLAAVEEMPADKFGYRPTPQQMSFARLVLHITESNNYFCAKIGDVPEPKAQELKETDGKDKLVAALRHSFVRMSCAPQIVVRSAKVLLFYAESFFVNNMRARTRSSVGLLQLRILRLGFLQDGDIGVGVFPEATSSGHFGNPTRRTRS